MSKIRMFSISHYVQAALKHARYEVDENDVILAYVPSASGFFSQGESFEEARENLRDTVWSHPDLHDVVVLSGQDGDDAKPYQEKDVNSVLVKLEDRHA